MNTVGQSGGAGAFPGGGGGGGNLYTIGGVKVQFPVKAYPSQMAMMAQIMKGLQRRQNCLLESPTGSGKTLAILCSALAWQQAQKDKAQRYNDLVSQGITDPDILARAAGLPHAPTAVAPPQDLPPTPLPTPTPDPAAAAHAAAFGGGFIPEEEDDFWSQDLRFRLPQEAQERGGDGNVSLNDTTLMDPTQFNPTYNQQNPQISKMRVPKIFFGTRTHKQIDQIIRELRRTAYKGVRSVVLSSREHSCIHPHVSKLKNKNEECRLLNDLHKGPGCIFNHGVNKIKTHVHLERLGLVDAWDVEDLVQLGKKIKACPYYAARSLLSTAEIVMCPYNYLVDPLIRDAMEINLSGHVVVLDEAHNIEDSAREAASCTLTQTQILEARNDMERIALEKYKEQECKELAEMLSALNGWVNDNSDRLTDYTEFDRSGKIFTGTEMVACLENIGIGETKYIKLKNCLASLTEDMDSEDENPHPASTTTMLLKSFFLMCHFLFVDGMKYCGDYRVALVKTQIRKKEGLSPGGWFSRGERRVDWAYSINFWCLNPGVSFSCLGNGLHSIILTSGTLSPMASFQSELGVPFKVQLEANHVIDRKQLWVGSVGRGPREKVLQATFRQTESWEFQDELGQLVLDVCRAVPGGVLCFLPSYALLNKLLDRWQNTGIWDELNGVKIAMTEPRRAEEFEETISLFYNTIRNTQVESENNVTGAFFMAVCRGKVSEGLDFTDDNARAVIAVGIPYPNFKDIQVDLKKQYNNTHSKSRGLLSGSDWYEIQAYRAVNQALGRCIRHRFDWGALILVDERYQRGSLGGGPQQNRYTRGLSKWVRNSIIHHHSFSSALASLTQFAETMTLNPPVKPGNLEVTVDAAQATSMQHEEVTAFSHVDYISSDVVGDTLRHPTQVDDNVIVEGSIKHDVTDVLTLQDDSLLLLPPKLPFTSTQLPEPKVTRNSYGSDDSLNLTLHGSPLLLPQKLLFTSTQFIDSRNHGTSSCAEEVPGDKEHSVDKETSDGKEGKDDKGVSDTVVSNKAQVSPVIYHPSKKRKSFSLPVVDSSTLRLLDASGTLQNQPRSLSPQLFDDDDFFLDNSSVTAVQNFDRPADTTPCSVSNSKESHFGCTASETLPSYIEEVQDDSSSVKLASQAIPHRTQLSKKKVSPTCSTMKKSSGKENSGCSNRPRKQSLGSQRLSLSCRDDEDMEDFNPNQSFQTPRQTSRSKKFAVKRRGIQYCDIDD